MGLKQIYADISEKEFENHKRLLGKCANTIKPGYDWNPHLIEIATNLIPYFAGLKCDYKIEKSIALCGTYGVGKSMLMRIFKEYMNNLPGYQWNHPNVFRIISIEDVIHAMCATDPLNTPILYNKQMELDRPVSRPANILINEFGFKYKGKSFGTDYQELIEMFIMKRYDIFQEFGKMTHVTMNFGTDELKEVFSDKILDRFKEMFNIIPVHGTSYRK